MSQEDKYEVWVIRDYYGNKIGSLDTWMADDEEDAVREWSEGNLSALKEWFSSPQ